MLIEYHIISIIIFTYFFNLILNKSIILSNPIKLILLLLTIYIYKFNRYIGTLIFILLFISMKLSIDINETFKINSKNNMVIDEIRKDEIMKMIKAKLDFNTNKSNLAKKTIMEIYNKYFGKNDIKILKQNLDFIKDIEVIDK